MELSECKVGDTVWKPAIVGTVVQRWNGPYPHKVKVKWKPGAPFAKVTESWEDPKDLSLVYSEEEEHPEVKAPSWNDAQVGGVVHFTYILMPTKAEVYFIRKNVINGTSVKGLLGRPLDEWVTDPNAVLVSVENPTPPLPTKPGVAIAVPGYTGLLHRRRLHSVHGKTKAWISDGGTFYTDEEIQRMGWEVAS